MTGTRDGAIERAEKYFDTGGFLDDLQRRVAIPTTSQEQGSMPALQQYVSGEMSQSLGKLGYDCTVLPNPRAEYGPFLIARRIEDEKKPTVLTYGHGDVIRGQDDQWRSGLSPWKIVIEGEKMYGRGTADNKGQHTINIAALACVLEERGSLGFNSTILIETGEETGSPGLAEFCKANKAALRADALIGSDGPRLDHRRPCIFGGTRGTMNFNLKLALREGGHHSGNWGGLLANPGEPVSSPVSIRMVELKPSAPRSSSTQASAAMLMVCWPLLSAVPRPYILSPSITIFHGDRPCRH